MASHGLRSSGLSKSCLIEHMTTNEARTMNLRSSQDQNNRLMRAFVRSIRQNALAELAVHVVRILGMVILARTLQPADFGLFRVLLMVSSLVLLTSKLGIPDALVQRQEITPEHESTSFWLGLMLAFVTAASLYAGAGAIARLMAMPELVQSVRLLCVPILIDGASATSNARLIRRLEFGVVAAADVAAEFAFLATALISLFMFHFPRGSLTLGLSARLLVHGLWIYFADGYWPNAMPRVAALRDLGKFGLSAWAGTMLNTVSFNADFVLIGRFMGPRALGLYSMAWELLRFVPDRLHRVAGRVTMPLFCRLQDNNDELGNAYGDFIEQIARIWLPIVCCVLISAPELLETLYGPKWIPAATPLRLLVPGLAAIGLSMGIGSIYYAKGHPEVDILLHGLRLFLICAAVITLREFGLFGVSLGVSLVEVAISVLGIKMACALIEVSLVSMAARTLAGAAWATALVILTIIGRTASLSAGLHSLPALLGEVALPALLFTWLQAAKLREFVSGKTIEVI